MVGRYKLIQNLGTENERIKYFDRLTRQREREIMESESYALLVYNEFLKAYMGIDYKLKESQREFFNANIERYCYGTNR